MVFIVVTVPVLLSTEAVKEERRVSFHLLLYLKSRLDTVVMVDRYSLDVLVIQETDNN
jgi:hypothetical protein